MDQPPGGGSEESRRPDENHPAEVSPSTSSCVSSRDQFNCSTGEIANSDANLVNGRLDLSNQNLTTLSPAFKLEYLEVVELDVSGNQLHSLKSKWFPNCLTLNISGNYLSRLSSLAPLATTLHQLIASGNDINNLDGIQHFLRLERLSLADNALRVVPMLDTHSLRVVELNKNLLDEIPDFSRLCNLETLGLGDNKISTLKNASARLPQSLKELDISGNPIVDISELVFLAFFHCVKKINIDPLPCLASDGTASFNYRHLLLCLMHELEYIDGESVQKEDLICGEHLSMQGKVTGSKRGFRPGGGEEAHNYLREYLAREAADCVDNESRGSTVSATPLKKNMMKALQMKEQYESEGSSRQALSPRQEPFVSHRTATDDDFSTHSPFAEWSRHMGKENADPETTDASSIPSARSPITRGRRVIETGVGRKTTFRRSGSVGSRLSSFASSRKAGSSNEGQRKAGEEEDEQSTLRDTSCSPSTSTTPTPRLQEEEPPRPKPRTTMPPKTQAPMENRKIVAPSSPFHPNTPTSIRRTPRSSRVADVTFLPNSERRIPGNEGRIQVLEEKVDALMEQNELLSKTNEELSLFLADQQEKYMAMLEHCQQQIDRLGQEVREKREKPPTPFGLGVAKRTEHTAEVKWELRHVQEYIVFINGQNSGKVTAPSRVARISDLNPQSSHTIQLQAIGLDGSLGELSSPLKIPPLDQ